MSGDWYTWAWGGWILYFILIEGLAIRNRQKGDTLSEHVWASLLPKRGAKLWRLRRFGLTSFLAWLVLHFLTGGAF